MFQPPPKRQLDPQLVRQTRLKPVNDLEDQNASWFQYPYKLRNVIPGISWLYVLENDARINEAKISICKFLQIICLVQPKVAARIVFIEVPGLLDHSWRYIHSPAFLEMLRQRTSEP